MKKLGSHSRWLTNWFLLLLFKSTALRLTPSSQGTWATQKLGKLPLLSLANWQSVSPGVEGPVTPGMGSHCNGRQPRTRAPRATTLLCGSAQLRGASTLSHKDTEVKGEANTEGTQLCGAVRAGPAGRPPLSTATPSWRRRRGPGGRCAGPGHAWATARRDSGAGPRASLRRPRPT